MTVEDNVVAVSKDTLDLAASIREPGNDLPQAFHAVFDQRIVLAIGGDSVKPEGIFDPAFDHSFVEGDGDVLLVSDMGFLLDQNIALALAAVS